MTGRDALGAGCLTVGGAAGGMIIGPLAAVILGVTGAAVAGIVIRAGIRWAVALPVIVGTAAGALLGWAIAHAFCRPDDCPLVETVAAIVTGIGSFVGVGLVVALAVRSFDEYRQAGPGAPGGTDGAAPPP
jgi:hypothetical protein